MKKILSLVLATALLLTLAACGGSGSGDNGGKNYTGLQVGWGQVNITPDYMVGLTGYGNVDERMTSDYIDYLYATCIAISEGGQTVLIYTVDNINFALGITQETRALVHNATGIPEDNMFFGATHTHSGPTTESGADWSKNYRVLLKNACVEAAETALADLAPATMLTASKELEKMTFVRHYIHDDGQYSGSNYNEHLSNDSIVAHTTEADNEMRLVKFDRTEKQDILLVNWQAHVDHAAENGMKNMSSDYPGAMRDYILEETDILAAFIPGASGNLGARTKIPGEAEKLSMRKYGEKLAQEAISMLDSLTPIDSTGISTQRKMVTVQIDHTWDHMIAQARQIKSIWDKQSRDKATEAGREYGFSSAYHANAIISRVSMPNSEEMELKVCRIGNLGLVNGTYEMFSENGEWIKENSPFDVTLILEGNSTYQASEAAHDYRCYEADTGRTVKGTAEQLAKEFVDMLTAIK